MIAKLTHRLFGTREKSSVAGATTTYKGSSRTSSKRIKQVTIVLLFGVHRGYIEYFPLIYEYSPICELLQQPGLAIKNSSLKPLIRARLVLEEIILESFR